MVNRRIYLGTLWAMGLALGFTGHRAYSPDEAAPAFILPSARDLASAKPSELFRAGAAREDLVRSTYLVRGDFNRYAINPFLAWHPTDEEISGARDKIGTLLGKEQRRAYLGTGMIEGTPFELYLEIKRDPRERVGAKGRYLRLDRAESGLHFDQSAAADALHIHYNHAQGALLYQQYFEEPKARSLYRETRVEFPLREEKTFPGRYFAWNVDREEYDVVSAIKWRALSASEARGYVARYGAEFRKADKYRRGPITGQRLPASPPIDF